jgi:hypothetical protein
MNRTLRHGVLAILGQHSRINADQAARMAEPEPPRQFADLDRLARYQATRRAVDAVGDGNRLAVQYAAACRGDASELSAMRAAMLVAFDMAAERELPRDLAQDVRGAGL